MVFYIYISNKIYGIYTFQTRFVLTICPQNIDEMSSELGCCYRVSENVKKRPYSTYMYITVQCTCIRTGLAIKYMYIALAIIPYPINAGWQL